MSSNRASPVIRFFIETGFNHCCGCLLCKQLKRQTTSKTRKIMFFYHKKLFRDLDTFLEQTKSWNLDFRQLDTGGFQGMLTQYGNSNAQVGIGSFNRKFDQRGAAPEDCITFAILGRQGSPIIWRGVEVDQTMVMIYRPGEEIDCSSKPDFEVITYSISERLFYPYCHRFGIQDFDKFTLQRRVFPISSEARGAILKAIDTTNRLAAECVNGTDTEANRDLLELRIPHLIVRALAESLDFNIQSPLTERNRRALRKIENHLRYYTPPPTKVRDLCELTGISERNLQYLFMWKYGISPMAYLKRVRLNKVRRLLHQVSARRLKISDAANAAGFWHMGQFAKDYHHLFGELPSQTLANARSERG